MQLRIPLFNLLIVFLLVACSVPVVHAETDPWLEVVPGVHYQEFNLPGPNRAFVARMDRANDDLILDTALARDSLGGNVERTSSMAARMEDTVSMWEPSSGDRSHVVVAINGSGFDFATGDIPKGGQVVNGWYAKRYNDYDSHTSGFLWRLDRSAAVGQCVYNDPGRQAVIVPQTGARIAIGGLNQPRGANELVLYTPQHGRTTGTGPEGAEVVVALHRPVTVQYGENIARGLVVDIRDGQGSTPIPFDSVVISASGSARDALLNGLAVGMELQIEQYVRHLSADCQGDNNFSWNNIYATLHGDWTLLRGGQVVDPKCDERDEPWGGCNLAPRTAIGFDADHIYFIVVDGRQPGVSVGMNFVQLAEFARSIGVTDAVAQDGGGSSVMIIEGQIKNQPVDRCSEAEAYPRSYLPLVNGVNPPLPTPTPGGTLTPTPTATALPAVFRCERRVANAIMMVELQEGQFSQRDLVDFDQVELVGDALLRLGPGSHYGVIGTLQAGSRGFIVPHLGHLNGVLAKGEYWWKIDVSGQTGWVSEDNLRYVSAAANGMLADWP